MKKEKKRRKKKQKRKKMPCVHGNIFDHDTAAEIFVAGFVGCWLELLDLPGLAF